MIAFLVFAIINCQVNARRKPRLIVRVFVPYVSMTVLFAAYSLKFDGSQRVDGRGIIETSDPESIKNFIFVIGSEIVSRRL